MQTFQIEMYYVSLNLISRLNPIHIPWGEFQVRMAGRRRQSAGAGSTAPGKWPEKLKKLYGISVDG